MAHATWPTREVPILEAIAEIEARPGPQYPITKHDLAEMAAISEQDLVTGFRALVEDGYITHGTMLQGAHESGFHSVTGPRLRGKGRRAIRQWPGEDPFHDLIDVLERLIAATDEPEEKTRLEKLKAALWGLGEKVGTAVAIAWGESVFGPHP
jgi:hypothetical protein